MAILQHKQRQRAQEDEEKWQAAKKNRKASANDEIFIMGRDYEIDGMQNNEEIKTILKNAQRRNKTVNKKPNASIITRQASKPRLGSRESTRKPSHKNISEFSIQIGSPQVSRSHTKAKNSARKSRVGSAKSTSSRGSNRSRRSSASPARSRNAGYSSMSSNGYDSADDGAVKRVRNLYPLTKGALK